MSRPHLPRVLCVDDESRVVEGLSLHLRRDYEVHTAISGDEALQKLAALGTVAVIVSDMRMPGMNGATLLKQVTQQYPDTTRILLTGEPGREAAVLAINEGQVFRFLTKPCAPDKLKATIEAGVAQHRLVTAERVLLQDTLIGSIQALVDVLAITNPVAFGRANRIKRMAMTFAAELGCGAFWQLDAAAMLSQLGYLSLPVELVEKLYYGERLTPEEQILAGGVPLVSQKLLGHIPRLEPVVQILEAAASSKGAAGLPDGTVGLGAKILSLVLDYDALITQGGSTDVTMQTLRSRADKYDQKLVEQFAWRMGATPTTTEVREIPLRLVQPGMTILQDVRTSMGTLLVPRGFEVTATFLQKISNFGAEIMSEKVKVKAPASQPPLARAAS